MRILFYFLPALLCGCVNTLDQVRSMSAADLATARAKAAHADDLAGEACWKALSVVPSPPGTEPGVATGIEDARIVAMSSTGPCSGIFSPVIMLIRP